jgi:hypothetical protein
MNDVVAHCKDRIADGWRALGALGSRLHRCERGDIPIGQIVMIALVVVPLLLVLFFFRDQATDLINTWWQKITSNTPATAS